MSFKVVIFLILLTIFSYGQKLVEPKLIYLPSYSVPYSFAKLKKEIYIDVDLLVNDSGGVDSVGVVNGYNRKLDLIATNVGANSKFSPAYEDSIPIQIIVPLSIKFSYKDYLLSLADSLPNGIVEGKVDSGFKPKIYLTPLSKHNKEVVSEIYGIISSNGEQFAKGDSLIVLPNRNREFKFVNLPDDIYLLIVKQDGFYSKIDTINVGERLQKIALNKIYTKKDSILWYQQKNIEKLNLVSANKSPSTAKNIIKFVDLNILSNLSPYNFRNLNYLGNSRELYINGVKQSRLIGLFRQNSLLPFIVVDSINSGDDFSHYGAGKTDFIIDDTVVSKKQYLFFLESNELDIGLRLPFNNFFEFNSYYNRTLFDDGFSSVLDGNNRVNTTQQFYTNVLYNIGIYKIFLSYLFNYDLYNKKEIFEGNQNYSYGYEEPRFYDKNKTVGVGNNVNLRFDYVGFNLSNSFKCSYDNFKVEKNYINKISIDSLIDDYYSYNYRYDSTSSNININSLNFENNLLVNDFRISFIYNQKSVNQTQNYDENSVINDYYSIPFENSNRTNRDFVIGLGRSFTNFGLSYNINLLPTYSLQYFGKSFYLPFNIRAFLPSYGWMDSSNVFVATNYKRPDILVNFTGSIKSIYTFNYNVSKRFFENILFNSKLFYQYSTNIPSYLIDSQKQTTYYSFGDSVNQYFKYVTKANNSGIENRYGINFELEKKRFINSRFYAKLSLTFSNAMLSSDYYDNLPTPMHRVVDVKGMVGAYIGDGYGINININYGSKFTLYPIVYNMQKSDNSYYQIFNIVDSLKEELPSFPNVDIYFYRDSKLFSLIPVHFYVNIDDFESMFFNHFDHKIQIFEKESLFNFFEVKEQFWPTVKVGYKIKL